MKNLREYIRLTRIQIHRSQRLTRDPDGKTLVMNSSATSMVVELSSHPFSTDGDLITCLQLLGLQPGTSDGKWGSSLDRIRSNTAITAASTVANGSARLLLKKNPTSLEILEQLYTSMTTLSLTHSREQTPILHLHKLGDDAVGRCYGLELNRGDTKMLHRYKAVIELLLVYMSQAEILMCMILILEGQSVGGIAEIIPVESNILDVFDPKGYHNNPSRYRIYLSCAGGLERNVRQLGPLTGTYTFDFSKLFGRLPCFRGKEIPEILRGSLSFDLLLRQIDEVTVRETEALASVYVKAHFPKMSVILKAMLVDDATIPEVDEGGVTKGLAEQRLKEHLQLFIKSQLPVEEWGKSTGVQVELPLTDHGRVPDSNSIIIVHFIADAEANPQDRLDEDLAQILALQLAFSLALDVSADSPLAGLFWCMLSSSLKEYKGIRTPQSCSVMRVTFMNHYTNTSVQSKSRVRIRLVDHSGVIQHKHLHGSHADVLVQQIAKMYLADVQRMGSKAILELAAMNPKQRTQAGNFEKSDIARPYTGPNDRYLAHLRIPEKVRSHALSSVRSISHEFWPLGSTVDPSLQVAVHPQNILVMPLDEVLNASITLQPAANVEVSSAKIAARCSQCHAILEVGLVFAHYPLKLCCECCVFLIRQRAYERQDQMWQHLFSFIKENKANRMDQSEPGAAEDIALDQEEVTRRVNNLMSEWHSRECILRNLLILHEDGFELQASKGRRPLPRSLDTRELVREVIIQRQRFTVGLLHASTWIPELQNRIKTSEITLLCMINKDIQEIREGLVKFSVSAVDVAKRHALDLHSKLKTTSWKDLQYSSPGQQDDTTGGHKKATKRGERGPGPAPSSRNQEQATSSRRVSGAGQDGHHHDAASHSPAAKVTRPTGSSTAAPNHSSHQQQPEAPSGASGH